MKILEWKMPLIACIRRPVGVGTLITPWNLPLYLLSWKVAPAIGMGNTVICKPSELTPMTANLMMEVIKDSGLPDGVVNLIHGTGVEAGAPLVSHPDVDLFHLQVELQQVQS